MTREATATASAHAGDRRAALARADGRWLRQFLGRPGEPAEAAFAALIGRHGPMVRRICLDVLRDRDAAQDAAQAVFLVLARKAASIRKPEALGPWLHGVALRVARRARVEEARRRAAERRRAEMMPDRTSQQPEGDALLGYAELHEEIDRLPETYRAPIILCYMQGRTQAEAAAELGWPLGTVQVRLHRGRERLRSRLARRGAWSIALLGATARAKAKAAAPAPGPGWVEATAAAAVRFAAGEPTVGMVKPAVAALAESTLTAMLRQSLKVVALLAAALLIGSGSVALSRAERPAATVKAMPVEKARPVRKGPEPPALPAAPVVARPADVQEEGGDELPPADPPEAGDVRHRSPLAMAGPPAAEGGDRGRELFERSWVKNDPRSHGGDGLGPVFNAASCVACHHQGGTGGAGGLDRNIEIASALEPNADSSGFYYFFAMDFGAGRFDYRIGTPPGSGASAGGAARPARRGDLRMLAAIHPGFRESPSVVLHDYGTDPAYNAWRNAVPGQHGTIFIRTSERNPPPLFGLGSIDAIPDEAIEAAARRRLPGSSGVKGRVSRLKDGRIGRFGWKAQTANLKEFVVSAAAGEMGLEVPGRHQAADPRLPGLGAPGLDMNQEECDALTDFVRALPAPVAPTPADDQESAQARSGEETFKAIGCAHCHLPKLGEVAGLYSDLLLHDMSPRLGDSDTYAVFVGDAPRPEPAPPADRRDAGDAPATSREWRTPPLWGLRDSAPYLHDGRAATIDHAIALHAGEGASSARRFGELSPRRKRHVVAFLKSLAAPAADRPGR